MRILSLCLVGLLLCLLLGASVSAAPNKMRKLNGERDLRVSLKQRLEEKKLREKEMEEVEKEGKKGEQKKKAVVNAWLIPHSHDDVGWLKTIDEYYEQEVRQVYNTVVEELDKRADRKFIIVEMAFFTMWWAEATDAQKQLVFKYVEEKKVEFVLGGWCMNDDADPTYSGSINQMSEGHRFIYDTFGVMPKYGWHIDPFGLSSYYPTLFAKMGFEGHVINRIHYQLKDEWKSSKHLEFIWRGSHSLGSETEMFTHVLDSHYSFPSGFNFETDAPITDSNIASRASNLVSQLLNRASWFRSSHLLVPGGDDFRWQNAKVQYDNWDKLIDYINARSESYGLTIRYATLNEYFEAVHQENIQWPVYEKDFFPYADNAESYWTGFFTTHSELKGYIRSRAALLRATELFGLATKVLSTTSGNSGNPTQVQPLRWSSAEAQHHDGVTGTSKMKVIDMYYEHLADGSAEALELLHQSMGYLVEGSSGAPSFSDLADSVDNLVRGQFAPIVVGNTLGWSVHTVHEFVTTQPNISIFTGSGQIVRSQVVPYPFSDDGVTRYQVFFEANLPPAGVATYYAALSTEAVITKPRKLARDETPFAENSVLSVNYTLDQSSLIMEITNKVDRKSTHVREELMEYVSYTGSGQKSGAYIFRPVGVANRVSGGTEFSFVDGSLVKILYHEADATHVQAVRLYVLPGQPIENTLEIQFGIGPLKQNAEAIVRFTTSMSNSTLFSDNNGIEMRQRQAASGLIQQNYYPMVAQSFLTNQDTQFGLFSERTMGVASLAEGQIETMLHRRCSQDDGRGMGEALNDETTVYPTLRIAFGSRLSLEKVRPHTSVRFQHRPRNFYAPAVSSISAWANNHRVSFSLMKQALPDNIHLLAFKVVVEQGWSVATVRLHHIYETDTHPEMAVPVTVSLEDIFATSYSVSDELELSGVVPISKTERMKWTSEVPNAQHEAFWSSVHRRAMSEERAVQFNPMQIKTYEFSFD